MINQISLDLLSLCIIKPFNSFNNLKYAPHYKQSIYLIELQKRLVWIRGARRHLGLYICINTPPEQDIGQ